MAQNCTWSRQKHTDAMEGWIADQRKTFVHTKPWRKHICNDQLAAECIAGPSCFHSLTRIQRWRWSSMQKPAMASHFKTMGPTPAQHLQGPGAGTLSIIRELSPKKVARCHYAKKTRLVEWQLRSLKAPKGPPSPGTVESIAITKSASLHFPLYAKTGSEYIPIRRRCIHVKFQTIKSQQEHSLT